MSISPKFCTIGLRVLLAVGLCVLMVSGAFAHGERAQLAGMRMRTVHWFDTQVSVTDLTVGDEITVTGKFLTSEYWPAQLAGLEGGVFLNVGVPGPAFIRIRSRLNGVPMVRSTRLEKGQVYEYEVLLKARVPGRYHLHPLLNVKDSGSLVGKGIWLEVAAAPGNEPFVNELETMQGDVINLETYGLGAVKVWHIIWLVMGLAWLLFWLVRKELFIPRMLWVQRAKDADENPSDIITRREFVVAGVFFAVTLAVILTGYLYTDAKYPTTIPLQTGFIDVEGTLAPEGALDIVVEKASYKLGGRSLEVRAQMTNRGDRPLQISELLTANIRFINPDADQTMPIFPDEDLVAPRGLKVSTDSIAPGETVVVSLLAADSLWETQRMTGLIADPDSRFAAMLFYHDDAGEQYYQEIGGYIVPSFF